MWGARSWKIGAGEKSLWRWRASAGVTWMWSAMRHPWVPVSVEAGSEDWVHGAESIGVNLRPAAQTALEVAGAGPQAGTEGPV